jgi:hypothetical protein
MLLLHQLGVERFTCPVMDSGGSWTEYIDNEDDDEEDLTKEEMVEALQEAVVLTFLKSYKSRRLHWSSIF